MPFTRNVPKELLISVLSRNKSSEQSVICFQEGFYWLANRPATAKEKLKFFATQGRLELNSGIWDDVQVQRSGRSFLLPPFHCIIHECFSFSCCFARMNFIFSTFS